MEPRRATPLLVSERIEERLRSFLALGFERIDMGVDGVVSLRAGNSFVILATEAAMARFHPATVARLRQGPALLLHVGGVADALSRLPAPAEIVEIVARPPSEAVVQMAGVLLVVSERVPGPRWGKDTVSGARTLN
ncbi:MAG: hypothetical protein H3C38_13875 [Rhodospirillales bacterium]|nr:hypothetical protein [Rhodospirillales bacterium]